MEFIVFAAGYLLGCINSSIILTRLLEKKDVREFGSGNPGFTNTLRSFKRSTAILVFAGDAIKAVIALLIAKIFLPDSDLALYAAGIGVILGHNFPLFHKFKGGKGILVSSVAIMFADWRIGLIIFVVSVFIMFASRYVSLGSITGAVMLPVLAFLFHPGDMPFLMYSLVVSILAIYKHRQNIVRLLNGTENRFEKKS
ncbi:MAG: Glycerol-3-phosphate acyltransferase [Firmicutes bacterium ADurb.Bin193]|nr:MAG: Glycerol-3-phosphate acyltransferase [Firmicutes bacterium ADurb.Bin193]